MTENDLKIIAKKEIERRGWIAWWPPKVKFYERDIFGCFDFVVLTDSLSSPVFVQMTTLSNLSHRREKIIKFFHENNRVWFLAGHFHAYIWAYDGRKGKFEEIRVHGFA